MAKRTQSSSSPGHLELEHPGALEDLYCEVRGQSQWLAEPLETEDYCIQTMPDVSPTKWHLAHTSWFFETFLLEPAQVAPYDPRYGFLFNSYYQAVGPQYSRPRRGLLSRPTVDEVYRYRSHVDEHLLELIRGDRLDETARELLVLGLHHEQQHQELMLTDIKHVFSCNPLRPAYRASGPHSTRSEGSDWEWISHGGGLLEIGHPGGGFYFDNEGPRHQTFVQPFELASRLVTNGEFLDFIEDGGYRRPELWLSDGWATVQERGWTAPAYWEHEDDVWKLLTLGGFRELKAHVPVCHVSYYEADAYARWAGARLPSEQEWEVMATPLPTKGNFVESRALHPLPSREPTSKLRQMYGDVWEWTRSPYVPYPGYHAPEGAVGEYNGKFMCDQFVLRGGSCVTPASHIRSTYRNFFPADARWQFSGFRIARDG